MISIDIDRNEPGNLSSDSWWSQKRQFFLQLQVERTSDMVLRHDLASALEAGLEAPAPATAAYFALAWKMKFQVALPVFFCGGRVNSQIVMGHASMEMIVGMMDLKKAWRSEGISQWMN